MFWGFKIQCFHHSFIEMSFDHSLPRGGLTRPETGLLLGAAVLLALAVLGPAVPASEHQHGFADQRMLWGLPCALDVLTNLPFALAGLWGLFYFK